MFFSVKRRVLERSKTMNADEEMTHGGGSAESQVDLSEETVSKIREFVSNPNHSNGEGAEKLRGQLANWLREIISYCCLGISGKTHPKVMDGVAADVVLTVEECISVRIEIAEGEARGRFKRGALQSNVEKTFLTMLDNAAAHNLEECTAE